MTKGILCAIDFQDFSKETIRWSVELARKLNEHLTVLYAYRLLLRNGEALEMKKKIEGEAQESFSILEKELLLGKGVSYDFKSEIGFMADRVKEHEKNNEVDFLVIGKYASNANSESMNELIKTTKVPLMIVP
jgi:nucleotide-binding universal stress UspA family protein